jgi:hypothetical protein
MVRADRAARLSSVKHSAMSLRRFFSASLRGTLARACGQPGRMLIRLDLFVVQSVGRGTRTGIYRPTASFGATLSAFAAVSAYWAFRLEFSSGAAAAGGWGDEAHLRYFAVRHIKAASVPASLAGRSRFARGESARSIRLTNARFGPQGARLGLYARACSAISAGNRCSVSSVCSCPWGTHSLAIHSLSLMVL